MRARRTPGLPKSIACPALKVLPDIFRRCLPTPNPFRNRGAAKENDAARDVAPKAIDGDEGSDAASGANDGSCETNKMRVHRLRAMPAAVTISVADQKLVHW